MFSVQGSSYATARIFFVCFFDVACMNDVGVGVGVGVLSGASGEMRWWGRIGSRLGERGLQRSTWVLGLDFEGRGGGGGAGRVYCCTSRIGDHVS